MLRRRRVDARTDTISFGTAISRLKVPGAGGEKSAAGSAQERAVAEVTNGDEDEFSRRTRARLGWRTRNERTDVGAAPIPTNRNPGSRGGRRRRCHDRNKRCRIGRGARFP